LGGGLGAGKKQEELRNHTAHSFFEAVLCLELRAGSAARLKNGLEVQKR
jgi:hypothetical protein